MEKISLVKASTPMKEQFRLSEWMMVVDPVKFHESLLSDFVLGPQGPRGRTGAIQGDVDLYIKALGL